MRRVFQHAFRALAGALLIWVVSSLARATAAPAQEAAAPAAPAAPATLAVQVVDDSTGAAVPFASLVFVETRRGYLASEEGRFLIELPAGLRRYRVMHVSYRESSEMEIRIAPGERASHRVGMQPLAVTLPAIEVSAAAEPSPRIAAHGGRTLEPRTLDAIPNLRDDPFQLLRVLPGVSPDDVGTEFHMRGGGIHETLVLIDGMEMRELFHGRDFGGITGIVPFRVMSLRRKWRIISS